MYNVSSNSTIQQWYKDAVYNPNRRLKFELYINDNLIDNAYVLDRVEIEYDTMQDGFSVGNIVYSKLSFSLYSSVIIFEMANISIFISVEIFNTSTNKYEYIRVPMGQFKVVDIESTKLQHKITAYDKYYNQLQMPFVKTKNQYTSGEILSQITSETGIQFKGFPTDVVLANEDIVTKKEDSEGNEVEERKDGTNFDNQTYASILGLVAGVCGGNIIFDREGACKLVVGLPQSDVAVLPQDFTEPTIKPFTYDKKRLEITKREDLQPIKVGTEVVTANQTLAIANPLFTTDSANRVLDIVNDISYQPISTKIMIMPLHLEPLDVISILYEDSTLKIPLMKYKLTFGGGLSGEMESFVSNQTQGGYQGSLTTQVSNLSSQVANMSKLVVGSIVAGDISALTIKVDELTANLAKINTLIAGNLTAENFQSMNITSDKFTMSDGFIKDAHIMNVNASKINAGKINTSNVSIGSRNDDGEMLISDNTIQINDKNGTRIQIGKDAQGQYNLYVWDKNGQLMWSANGLTQDGIQDAIIRDDMVSDNANINAKKLDIESLFTQMNKDGSNTLKASKIFLDTEKQTLNIAFNQMTTKQELLTEKTNTLTTQLNTQQGQIDTLIKNTTITDDGQTTTLKDAYSQFVQTQNGFNLKVEEHESKFNNLKIGTRNYLSNTQNPFTMTGNNTTNQTSTMYHFVNKDNSPIIGGEATFAFKYKIEEGATGAVRIQTNGAKTGDATEGKWFNLYRNDNITTMENEGQVVYTRTYNESDLNTFTGVSIRLDNFVGSITVSECSMVVGNEFGGWQPAPEDTGEALSSLETRVSSAEQQVTKDAIISKVSSTFVKQTDFDNMTIGGRNLIVNSNFYNGFTNWNGNTDKFSLTDDNVLVYNQTGISKPQNYQLYTDAIDVSDYANKELTLTFVYNVPNTSLNTTPIIACVMFFEDDTSTTISQAVSFKYISYDSTYASGTRAKHTSVIVPSEEAKFVRIYTYMSQNGKAYWTNFQLEVGNVATDWSPSPKDTEESLSTLETRVQTAESKITKDAIISTVSSTFVKQTDFNNLTIGGENLIINSNFYFGFENWKGSTTQYYITEDNMLGYNQLGLTEAKNYQVYTKPIDVSNLVGKEVTVSFDYKIIDKTQQSTISIGYIRFFDADHEGSNAQADSIAYKTLNLSNNYVNGTVERAMATVTVPQNAKYARVGAYQSRNGNMYWSNFQLEVGNKASGWKASSQDIKLYADSSNDMLQNELNDLKNIADLSNNADTISPDMKTKLIAECEDAESVYNKLIAMYEVMGSPVNYKSLFTNMKNSFSTLSSEILYLKSSQNEISNSGLGDLLQLFNNFYTFAEELNKAILNSLKGITDGLSTEIKQLASSVEIKINEFSSELGSISTHFIFDTNGLTIKSSQNASKYIKLDNDSLDFMDNGNKVAEVTNQKLNITKAEIKSDMKIGNMKIKPSGSSKNGVVFVFE